MSIDLNLHIILWPSGYKSINQKCFLVILVFTCPAFWGTDFWVTFVEENRDYEI